MYRVESNSSMKRNIFIQFIKDDEVIREVYPV